MWPTSPQSASSVPDNRSTAFSARPGCRLPAAARIVIEETVAQVFGVGRNELSRATRGRARIAAARQVAMYLAHVSLRLTMHDVGVLFARDRTTVAHACGVVEDRRDDPDFDRVLEMLEWTVTALLVRRSPV